MKADASGRQSANRDAMFGAVLFLIALAPRLYVALAWAGEPVWDGHYYDFGARRIAQGFGYSDDLVTAAGVFWHPWCHYPVGYSALLALFYKLFGPSHAVAAVTNALVGAALATVTWAVAALAMSPLRARVAGLLVALHPGLILYAALVMSEPLAALVTLSAFWLAVRDRRPWRGMVVGSVVLGLAALVRPQALLCAPFLAWVAPMGLAKRAAAAATACALALVVVMPWTLRNCRVMDGCALVSTNGGWNLAIGAFPRATGRFETLRSSDGCSEVTGQVQQDRCWLRYGWSQIRERPVHWLGLMPAKLGFTFDHESFAVEYLHEARPAAWPDGRRQAARGVTTLAHRLLLSAAVFGCFACPIARARGMGVQRGLFVVALALIAFAFASNQPTFWPLALFISIAAWLPLPARPPCPAAMLFAVALLATTLLTHAIFFGEDRYHIVVTPVLALFAAAALRRPETRVASFVEQG